MSYWQSPEALPATLLLGVGCQGGGPDGPKIDGMEVLIGNGGFKTIHSKSADLDSGFICCLRCGILQAA